MDIELLNQFREKVNDQELVLHIYRDYNGRNLWSIICSAMDWISIAVEAIDFKKLPCTNDNNSSIKVMTFIMCIDVLWEAIQQLHRVFFKTQEVPFNADDTVFQHKLFPATDNKYFKTIRACFASHPVNLNDNFTSEGAHERRYASWSGGGFGKGDFSVILYSNQPDNDSLYLDIYFDELQEFAEQRYDYLKTIMEEIDRQIETYLAEYREKPITKDISHLTQIYILINEAKQRFDNNYYNSELEKLKIIFETPICNEQNKNVVAAYRVALIDEIEELYSALQEMRLDELESEKRIETLSPSACQYAFSKLSDAVFGNGYLCLVDTDKFKNYLSSIVDLENIQSPKELYVVVKAGFYIYFCDQNSDVRK